MSLIREKEKRALLVILDALQQIDVYNASHEDAKEVLESKFITEISHRFDVGEKLASEWLENAKKLNHESHKLLMDQETIIKLSQKGDN